MVSKAKMQKEVCVGELPFRWQPECEFSWSGSWLRNKQTPCERNLMVVILAKTASGQSSWLTITTLPIWKTASMAE